MSKANDSAGEMFADPSPDETKDAAARPPPPPSVRRTWGQQIVSGGVALFCFVIMVAVFLLPVEKAREQGRRAVCLNNMRNLGLALASYETSRRAYPGYRDTLSINNEINVDGIMTHKVPVNWLVLLLPNLERNRPPHVDRYRIWKFITGIDIAVDGAITYQFPPVTYESDHPFAYQELFVCPSDPSAQYVAGSSPPLSYVVNSGLQDVPASATTPGDWPENGVFVSRWEMPPGTGQPPLITSSTNADTVSRGDGVSETIMLTENIEARSYSDVFRHVGQPGDLGSLSRPVSEQMTCFVWFPQDPLPDDRQAMKINGRPSGPSPDKTGRNPSSGVAHDITYARPSSNHAGGANFVFCDAHTQFISDKIDYLVYAHLMSSNGKMSRVPGTQQPLGKEFTETELDVTDILRAQDADK